MQPFSPFLSYSAAFFLQPSWCSHSPLFYHVLQPSSLNLHDAAILPFSIMFCSLLPTTFMMQPFSPFQSCSAAFFLQPSLCSHSPFFCSLLPKSFMMQPFSLFLQPSSYKLHVAAILPFSAAIFLQTLLMQPVSLFKQPSSYSLHFAAILHFFCSLLPTTSWCSHSPLLCRLLPTSFMMQPISLFL